MEGKSLKRAFFLLAILGTVVPAFTQQCMAQFSNPAAPASSAASIPESQLMQPAAVAKLLQDRSERALILQVGSHIMFAQAHIPGSRYAGPGSQAAGLQLLESKVNATPKDKLIVIYCGCCPWSRCPNMGPAYKRLRELGFTNVKALYIANNFGDDWVAKGYSVEKGE
jgi:thiosulfate/3-mercaptopyruvate sulfurtransferase